MVVLSKQKWQKDKIWVVTVAPGVTKGISRKAIKRIRELMTKRISINVD